MVEVHNDELSELLSQSESSELDFKSGELLTNPVHNNRKKIAQNLVGFANRNGGKLVIGVDDSTREPEGADIEEEGATGIISEISRDDCSPTVRFSHQFYSSESGDVSEGSVFVLEIEPGDDIPHARVDRSGAEITRREYRFRAGDETRLVSDQELQILFTEGDLDTDISERFSTFRVNTKKHIDAYPESLRQPEGVRESFRILQNMSSEEHDHLLSLPTKGNLHKTVAIYGFLLQFANRFSDSWLIDVETYPGKRRWKFDDSVEIDVLELDDIDGSTENTPFAEISHDPRNIMDHFVHNGFAVPSGTEISITHTTIDSTILIEKPEVFEFEIKFIVSNYGPHPPTGHPVNLQNPSQVESADIRIQFDAVFGFPDKRDPDYEKHRQYAESIVQMLREEWDAEHFFEQLPDRKLYEIESKVDEIRARLSPLPDPRMQEAMRGLHEEDQSEDSETE
ncbi:helix-turn-helix domain-containing protein [Haloarcula sp. Atlit-120R]|uniref:AlbA family DNA-binding domain-containing protein n=1 Tax=Haloarcula sp. Atlit-120R TaxID=2282135 RepID=UPI001314BF67|nr:ATP-binding protein [Haloarcula sp. Atlit-120R]